MSAGEHYQHYGAHQAGNTLNSVKNQQGAEQKQQKSGRKHSKWRFLTSANCKQGSIKVKKQVPGGGNQQQQSDRSKRVGQHPQGGYHLFGEMPAHNNSSGAL